MKNGGEVGMNKFDEMFDLMKSEARIAKEKIDWLEKNFQLGPWQSIPVTKMVTQDAIDALLIIKGLLRRYQREVPGS